MKSVWIGISCLIMGLIIGVCINWVPAWIPNKGGDALLNAAQGRGEDIGKLEQRIVDDSLVSRFQHEYLTKGTATLLLKGLDGDRTPNAAHF